MSEKLSERFYAAINDGYEALGDLVAEDDGTAILAAIREKEARDAGPDVGAIAAAVQEVRADRDAWPEYNADPRDAELSALRAALATAREALEPFKANGDPVWPKALAKLAAHDGAALAKHIVDLRTRADEALAAIDAAGKGEIPDVDGVRRRDPHSR
jgi:hypothetical protein